MLAFFPFQGELLTRFYTAGPSLTLLRVDETNAIIAKSYHRYRHAFLSALRLSVQILFQTELLILAAQR